MSRLSKLAIKAEGFIFDPDCGEVFTSNSTGLFILNCIRNKNSIQEIAAKLMQRYEISLENAEKDIFDFNSQLRVYRLLN